jgi:HTH-type transcriptional repressor of puuD
LIRENDIDRFVARRVRELRERAGFSRYELARRAGVGVAQVTRLESLERSPTVMTLARFCAALGCSLAEFFDERAPTGDRAPDGLGELLQVMDGLSDERVRRLARGLTDVAQAWSEPGVAARAEPRRPRRRATRG